jgi:hypothetical protein
MTVAPMAGSSPCGEQGGDGRELGLAAGRAVVAGLDRKEGDVARRSQRVAWLVHWLVAWAVEALAAIKNRATGSIARRSADRGVAVLPTFLRHSEVGS